MFSALVYALSGFLQAAPNPAVLSCSEVQKEPEQVRVTLDFKRQKIKTEITLDICVHALCRPGLKAFYTLDESSFVCAAVDQHNQHCVTASEQKGFNQNFDLVDVKPRGFVAVIRTTFPYGIYRETSELRTKARKGITLQCKEKKEAPVVKSGQLEHVGDFETYMDTAGPGLTKSAFLKRLDAHFKKNATVNFASRGLIHSSVGAPGIVTMHGFNAFGLQPPSSYRSDELFDFQKITFLAFSADHAHPAIDVSEFDKATRSYSYAQIIFDRNEKPRLRRNPVECLACHSVQTGTTSHDFRGLWDLYPNWIGFYGSENLSLVRHQHKKLNNGGASLIGDFVTKSELKRDLLFYRNSRIEEALTSANDVIYAHDIKTQIRKLKPVQQKELIRFIGEFFSKATKVPQDKKFYLAYLEENEYLDFKKSVISEYRKYVEDLVHRENESYKNYSGRRLFAPDRVKSIVDRRVREGLPFLHVSLIPLLNHLLNKKGLSTAPLSVTFPGNTHMQSHPLSFESTASAQFQKLLMSELNTP